MRQSAQHDHTVSEPPITNHIHDLVHLLLSQADVSLDIDVSVGKPTQQGKKTATACINGQYATYEFEHSPTAVIRELVKYHTFPVTIYGQSILSVEQHPDADQRLMKEAGRLLTNHHATRIRRIQTQISYYLRSRPDLLANIDQYNENNVDRLFKLQATQQPAGNIITRALENRHTKAEGDHVALLIMSVANLRAMTQINAEILSRDNRDSVTRAYQDVLFTLLQDAEHSQLQRDLNPIDIAKMRTLGVEHLAQLANQATERAREMASTQPLREVTATAELLEKAKQYANPAMPANTQTRFPIRELTDPEAAAIADGARVLTSEIRKLGLKWLSDGDHIAANAAHVVAEHFAKDFQFTFEHRLLPEEFDTPEERVLTPRRYTRAIKQANDLDQATEAIRQQPLARAHERYVHGNLVRAAALSGHAAALQWHIQRIRNAKPRQIHHPHDHATASWVHEDTIRRILEERPTPPRNLWRHWERALDNFDNLNNFDEYICIEVMRPKIHSPTVTSAFDHPAPVYAPMEPTPFLEREQHQMPQEWTVSYQYQDAHYAKRMGEPYHHTIDAHAAKQHALDTLDEIQDGIPNCSPQYVHHLENMAILSHEMAAAGLQSVSEHALTNAIETAFRHIPRSTAIHRIINDLADQRPTAAAHIKAVYHSGSTLLSNEQTAIIVGAARAAGIHVTALTEMCHRLQIKPELQQELGIPQTSPVNREQAEHVVTLIQDLSHTTHQAASTAAQEMGWTLTETTSSSSRQTLTHPPSN